MTTNRSRVSDRDVQDIPQSLEEQLEPWQGQGPHTTEHEGKRWVLYRRRTARGRRGKKDLMTGKSD